MNSRHLSLDERRAQRIERQKKLEEELKQIEQETKERIRNRSTSAPERKPLTRKETVNMIESERSQWEKKQNEELSRRKKEEEDRKKVIEKRVAKAEFEATTLAEKRRKEMEERERENLERKKKREELERKRREEELEYQKRRQERERQREEKRRQEEDERVNRMLKRRQEREQGLKQHTHRRVSTEVKEETKPRSSSNLSEPSPKDKETLQVKTTIRGHYETPTNESKSPRPRALSTDPSSNEDAARKARELVAKGEVTPQFATIRTDNTRVVKSVTPPTIEIFGMKELVLPNSDVNVDLLLKHFEKQGRVTKEFTLHVLKRAEEIFRKELNIVRLSAPVIIVGDIHGQYYDMLSMFKKAGYPDTKKYLFLGDYVDRGMFSFEVIMYLLSVKVTVPNSVWLLRGNHETRSMTETHSFKDEIFSKFDKEIYEKFMTLFDTLPLAAIVNNLQGDYFCCHGGIGPQHKLLSDIENINRFVEPTEEDEYMMDILWSDPTDEDQVDQRFKENRRRDCSVLYGYDAIQPFLEDNKLCCIVRAHEVKQEGHQEYWYKSFNPDTKIPYVITIFSAPNYCDNYSNAGSYMVLDVDIYVIHQFSWVEHPYVLPRFKNAFSFSMPFIMENVMQLLYKFMNLLSNIELEEEKSVEEEGDTKLIGLARTGMAIMKNLRLENESLIAPLKIDRNLVDVKGGHIARAHSAFASTKGKEVKKKTWFEAVSEMDVENEKLVYLQPSSKMASRRLRRAQTFYS